MRCGKIFSLISLALLGLALTATSVSAGPLLLSPFSEARAKAKELLQQAGSLLQEFQAISNVQAVLDHLALFENGLGDLGGKIEASAQIGKITVSYAKFVEIRIALCDAKVDLVEQDLTATGQVTPKNQAGFVQCRSALRVIVRRMCNMCAPIIRPLLSEQASTITLVESSVRRYAANGVYLIVRTYPDGRREFQKIVIQR